VITAPSPSSAASAADAPEAPLDLSQRRRLHVIGVGGPGMSAIALALAEMGHDVSGVDIRDRPVLDRLRAAGVAIHIGHNRAHVHGCDAVTFSSAIAPDLNELDAQGINLTFFHCFPHYFVLPMYSSASSYRFRPLGPEETLMEIWSLARIPEGRQTDRPTPPEVWETDDPRWPPIPAQDFSNIPKQQKGLHAKDFEYMRLSAGMEGHISNVQRTVDGFLADLPYDALLPALRAVNVYPFEQPILDLGF